MNAQHAETIITAKLISSATSVTFNLQDLTVQAHSLSHLLIELSFLQF